MVCLKGQLAVGAFNKQCSETLITLCYLLVSLIMISLCLQHSNKSFLIDS